MAFQYYAGISSGPAALPHVNFRSAFPTSCAVKADSSTGNGGPKASLSTKLAGRTFHCTRSK
eukprot:2765606-Pyramimonas_sp.AAC.1